MDTNLDLNIKNYNKPDLVNLFKLNNSNYTHNDVEMQENKMREQLSKITTLTKSMKQDLMNFLNTAKQKLINEIMNEKRIFNEYIPTTIPKNNRLDASEYIATKENIPREKELNIREKTEFIHVQNSDFMPGKLNPLQTRVISKCLTIDTRFRDNFYSTQSSDFQFQLPLTLNKVVSMSLSSFEIPVSFYGISSGYGNNFLFIKIFHPDFENTYNDELIEKDKIIIVPDGNYNAQDLINIINKLLCPVNIDGTPVNPDDLFSYIQLSLDISETGSGTGKVTIYTTGLKSSNIKSITLDFARDINGLPNNNEISSKIGWNLGFTQPKYEGKTVYLSDTIIEPATIRYIYLAVDDYNSSVNDLFMTAFNVSLMSPNVIARISIKGTYFSLLMENDLSMVTEPRIYFGPVEIQRLRIRLYDDHGRILQMNNANFSFCLVFKMLYDL
jgi:hypothetical protein